MAKDAKAALLLALTPKGGASDKGSSEPDGDEGSGYGARDVLDAIHDNDEKALEMALKTFVMKCMGSDEEES